MCLFIILKSNTFFFLVYDVRWGCNCILSIYIFDGLGHLGCSLITVANSMPAAYSFNYCGFIEKSFDSWAPQKLFSFPCTVTFGYTDDKTPNAAWGYSNFSPNSTVSFRWHWEYRSFCGTELCICFLTPCWPLIFNKVTICYSVQIANVGERSYHHHSAPWDKSRIWAAQIYLVIEGAQDAGHAAQFLSHNSHKFSVIISFSLINLVLIEGSWNKLLPFSYHPMKDHFPGWNVNKGTQTLLSYNGISWPVFYSFLAQLWTFSRTLCKIALALTLTKAISGAGKSSLLSELSNKHFRKGHLSHRRSPQTDSIWGPWNVVPVWMSLPLICISTLVEKGFQ